MELVLLAEYVLEYLPVFFLDLVLAADETYLLGRVEVDASIPICREAKHRDDKDGQTANLVLILA